MTGCDLPHAPAEGRLGHHIVAIFEGCATEVGTPYNLAQKLEEVLLKIGMEICDSYAGYADTRRKNMIAASVLSTSHAAVEVVELDDGRKVGKVDFYTCGPANTMLAVELMGNYLAPEYAYIMQGERGNDLNLVVLSYDEMARKYDPAFAPKDLFAPLAADSGGRAGDVLYVTYEIRGAPFERLDDPHLLWLSIADASPSGVRFRNSRTLETMFLPQGYSTIDLRDEGEAEGFTRQITNHTWPEKGQATFDLCLNHRPDSLARAAAFGRILAEKYGSQDLVAKVYELGPHKRAMGPKDFLPSYLGCIHQIKAYG